jgi:hypothetical protein
MSRLRTIIAVPYHFFVRVFIIVLGAAAFAWALVMMPAFQQQASIERIARHIIRGETYSSDFLERRIADVKAADNAFDCHPIASWSAAIIRTRMAENVRRARKPIEAKQITDLDNSIRRSISCSPAEPFLWLVLYWAENVKDKLRPQHLKYLELSYQLGPNEGWIALKRNPLGFENYDELSPGLRADVISEFLRLIKGGFSEQAADILQGPAWRLRDILIPDLASLPLQDREIFSRAMYNRGIDVRVPGVRRPQSRPWQH